MRRADDIERYDTKVSIAEATECVQGSIIRFCEGRVARPRYCCAQGPWGFTEMAEEIAVVAGHVSAHAH